MWAKEGEAVPPLTATWRSPPSGHRSEWAKPARRHCRRLWRGPRGPAGGAAVSRLPRSPRTAAGRGAPRPCWGARTRTGCSLGSCSRTLPGRERATRQTWARAATRASCCCCYLTAALKHKEWKAKQGKTHSFPKPFKTRDSHLTRILGGWRPGVLDFLG